MARLSRLLHLVGILLLIPLSSCSELELLNPKGEIGAQEKTLILVALGLMLLVVIPVMFLTVYFAWRYRASNVRATYAPTWTHSTAVEVVVWTVPCLIVAILAVMIWETTDSLDPFQPLKSKVPPVRVEVVALNWKWLFIYPDYGVASINYLSIPVDTPVEFKLTAESMMNSFFIPQLGSQIYAMAGMQTQLHLIANEPGTYAGLSSAFSGPGFSDMHFAVAATSQKEFADWVHRAKRSTQVLNAATYRSLEQPSIKNPVTFFAKVDPGLFETIVNRFMSGKMSEMAFATSDLCTAEALPPIARSEN
ncbi:ubiquinol oxidase subunit II|uniref:ubiquinol oxidase subunit II n=1 Tax=Rhizobium altiplani TaxID=1864509 RepID=UPI0009E678E7|nr:ubiquinol oxidase subunit II [Rhizobium altiplani]